MVLQHKQNISPDCIKKFCCRYLLYGAILLGIPLLGVQTDDYSMTQEKGCPHDYVPDGTFPLVMQNEVEHHCRKDEGVINKESNNSLWVYLHFHPNTVGMISYFQST